MASAASAMTRQAASGPALRSTNPLTPGRPARNGDMAGDGRFPGLRVVAGTTFPGRDPVAFGAGFPLTVAGAAPASHAARELSQIACARYSLLVLPEDRTPSAG